MKNLIFIVVISFVFCTFWGGCGFDLGWGGYDHDNGCMKFKYHFSLPVSFEPTDSIVYVGDTVTITSQFPNKLWNIANTELFIFDSVDFKINCHFIKVDTLIDGQGRFDFLDDFEIMADSIFNYRRGRTTTAFDYYYDGNQYFLQFKFIPKEKGVYVFEFASRINRTHNIKGKIIYTENGECSTNNWGPSLVTNEGEGYVELLKKYSPNEYYSKKSGSNFSPETDGAHCFKVE